MRNDPLLAKNFSRVVASNSAPLLLSDDVRIRGTDPGKPVPDRLAVAYAVLTVALGVAPIRRAAKSLPLTQQDPR